MRSNPEDIYVDALAFNMQDKSVEDIRADEWMYDTHALAEIIRAKGKDIRLKVIAAALEERLFPLGGRTKSKQITGYLKDSIHRIRPGQIGWTARKDDWTPKETRTPDSLNLKYDPTVKLTDDEFQAIAKALFRREEALRYSNELLGDSPDRKKNGTRKLHFHLARLIQAGTPMPIRENNYARVQGIANANSGDFRIMDRGEAMREHCLPNFSAKRFLVCTRELIDEKELNVPRPFRTIPVVGDIRRPFLEG